MILCEVEWREGSTSLARVRDLNEWGIRIAINESMREGDLVRVKLPGTDSLSRARVAWSAKGIAGLYFTRAIDFPQIAGARRGILDAA